MPERVSILSICFNLDYARASDLVDLAFVAESGTEYSRSSSLGAATNASLPFLFQCFLRAASNASSQNKIYQDFNEAVKDIPHGARLLVGGDRRFALLGSSGTVRARLL